MNSWDDKFCWLCSMPGSFCDCEFSDSPWSKSTSRESCILDSREKRAGFHTIDHFLGGAPENSDPGKDDMIQYFLGRGSQRPCAASTPKNDDHPEKLESPGTIPSPNTSSPVGFGTDSSLFSISTDPALSMSRREDVTMVCVKGPSNDHVSTTTLSNRSLSLSSNTTYLTQECSSARIHMGPSSQVRDHPVGTSKGSHSSVPTCRVAQVSLDERLHAISERHVVADDISVNIQDIGAITTCSAIEQTDKLEKLDEIGPASARSRAIFSGPTIFDLAISTELEPASSHGTENDRSYDATSTSSEITGNDDIPSKMPSRGVSIVSVSYSDQATLDGHLKRRRSSVDCLPELKKVKLDWTASRISCSNSTGVESKYQAIEPASIRRARSLRSEVSACSEESTGSLFYPSPLSSSTVRPCPEKDYPPTIPSTPLPDSMDYARSRANPLVRTVAVYRRRPLNAPSIPPVPIIAPPPHTISTLVRCAEDQAIERLRALLLRERSERKRDGLSAHDEKRTGRLKAICATYPAFSRRDSASTSDSSDGPSQWEEESTRSTIESQEIQESTPSVKLLPGRHRLVNRETWSGMFGITNDFRKEVTRWILEILPTEPVPREKPCQDGRHLGTDLYDQLTSSRQTRFHAAQLFHRYFLLPEKVQFWREACKYECLERESWGFHDDSDCERGVWDLAVACVALSVKLHRDCLPPLGPVYAFEFLDMAPHSMTHETFELAQRDIMYTVQFLLGSCTPQCVLDELWNALPTLRKVTASMRDGWAVVQCVIWDKLFESLLEPDMLQYPVILLTAAALVDGLIFTLARHYRTEAEINVCRCNAPPKIPVAERVTDDIEPTSWQIHLFEATQLVDDVILDVKDVLQLSDMELDECRTWLSYVGQE